MEQQGNGRHAIDAVLDGPTVTRRHRHRLMDLLRERLAWLLCCMLLACGVAHAQSTRYVYDANGRVVAVTANSGASVQYTYNTLGHASQISAPLSPAQLAIFAFMPTHGEAGTQVTLQGQGFDSHAANDTVSFNGTMATVVSASPTQLAARVPGGVMTGPISVTVAGKTVSSAAPFVVDDTGVPPTITRVSPVVVTTGQTVTVTGTHLDPVAGDTRVQMGGGNILALASINDTQLQYAVPSSAVSGHVTVDTPYGEATSASPVVVLPSSINAANVVSSGYVAAGGSVASLNIGAAGQMGTVVFDGTAGEWASLQLSNLTTTASSISYVIYAPGNVQIQQGTISTSSPTVHLPPLTTSGAYLAVFQPNTAGAQFAVAMEIDPVSVNNVPLAVSTAGAAQTKRLVISATAGSNLELTLENVNVVGGGANGVNLVVYNAAGTSIASFGCNATGSGASCRAALWSLGAGTYTAIVTPMSGGTMSFSALLQPDIVGGALTANTPAAVTLGVGQIERFTFTANAGDTVALNVSGVSTTPSGQPLYAFVFSPTTQTITTSNAYVSFNTGSSTTVNLANLPATGTYTVVFYTAIGIPASAQLTLVPGVTGTMTRGGAAQSYATTESNQNAYLNFTANAGDNLELELENVAVAGGGNSVQLNVYNASGNSVAAFTCNASSGASCRAALWNLTAGTYTAIVSPTSGGTMSFSALLQPDIVGGTLTRNTPVTVNLGVGQIERFTFTANAGDTVALNVSGVSTTPSGQPLYAFVFSPTTQTITTNNAYASFNTGSSTTVNLANLPATGTYTVVFYTAIGIPASAQLTLVPGVTGTMTRGGAAQSYATTESNQNAYLNFTANAGDNLELELENVAVTGGGSSVQLNVYAPSGSYVTGFTCNAGSVASCRAALWNLVSGVYTAIVSPTNGGTIHFDALLQPDVMGGALTANTPVTVNLGVGQIERFTFTANAGATVSLNVSGVSTTPSGQPLYAFVFSPSTQTIMTNNAYASFNTAGSTIVNLANLPSTGAYTVVFYTAIGIPASAQLTLVPQ
ncbi:IPT/TIG domain protein [Burkholderia thailandensis MSMB121]|uniref:beta strand repeat-containing protein n=1 Tax=Burkholderia humptydooensis TaxID=430531 RepID=UPI000327FFA0|nr:IPT/TIG domain-containing protein [Burkholderia humptydooensis]AGK46933.1 IPT/TIG domain protein [Burkholderia thailandensis MSMB121]ATF37218.1 glutamate synthase [Burkholderia thailandensis]KST74590.1 glutamate synthase [Burkholderia humptydooensis]